MHLVIAGQFPFLEQRTNVFHQVNSIDVVAPSNPFGTKGLQDGDEEPASQKAPWIASSLDSVESYPPALGLEEGDEEPASQKAYHLKCRRRKRDTVSPPSRG